MPYKGRRSYKSKAPLRVTPTRKSKSSAVEKVRVSNIKRVVKSVMTKQIETKVAPYTTIASQQKVYGAGLNYNGVGLLNGWASPNGILPPVTQGLGENNRVGNVIAPNKLVVKYEIKASQTTDGTSTVNDNPFRALPFLVRMVIYRHRYATDDFGQYGLIDEGGSNVELGANPALWMEPYNRDEYIIAYSRTFKMASDVHRYSGTTLAIDAMPNNLKQWVYGKAYVKLPKKLRYNDTTNIPTNAQWYIAFAVCNQDGSAISTSQQRITVNVRSTMTYKDA
uniref:Capsid protein n=1 Tax=Cressdnaviricota sp. TaxID=2748378 RepID=A0A890UZ96_9VIRU|nr:MAG: capsid protein [Cressdnaviricota sp.]